MGIDYSESNYREISKENRIGKCIEDKAADILLNGGTITIIDINDDGTTAYGKLPHESFPYGNDDFSYPHVAYQVSLKDFYIGLQKEEAVPYVNQLIEEEDDFYTGYNLLQIITFGEIIYG